MCYDKVSLQQRRHYTAAFVVAAWQAVQLLHLLLSLLLHFNNKERRFCILQYAIFHFESNTFLYAMQYSGRT